MKKSNRAGDSAFSYQQSRSTPMVLLIVAGQHAIEMHCLTDSARGPWSLAPRGFVTIFCLHGLTACVTRPLVARPARFGSRHESQGVLGNGLACRYVSYAFRSLPLFLVIVIGSASLSGTAHAGSPDLTVDSIWLEDASQVGQPVSQVSPGQSFNIVATIKNIGQDTASNYYLDVYYDSDYGRGGPDNIAPGEVQTWYVGPLTAQAGTHTTKWVVDPDNQIVELNESNNEKDYTFIVGSQTATTTVTSSSTSTQTSTLYSYGTTTKTVTSYTGTSTLKSTIVVPTTVVLVPSTVTSTVGSTQFLTSTGTTTVTSYTATTTSKSTSLVYTTVTKSAAVAAVASSPLVYLSFLSLLAVTVGHRVTATNGWRIPRSRTRRRCSKS